MRPTRNLPALLCYPVRGVANPSQLPSELCSRHGQSPALREAWPWALSQKGAPARARAKREATGCEIFDEKHLPPVHCGDTS